MENKVFMASEEYIQRIRAYYDKMSDSEKKIADYLLSLPVIDDDILNINVLAEKADTSVTTIVRFCRTLGFKGFSEFKFYIKKNPHSAQGDTNALNSQDSIATIKNKVATLVSNSIDSTVMMMDNGQLEAAIEAVSKAKVVMVWGEGPAAGVAQSAVAAFVNLGIQAISYNDSLTALRGASFLEEGDVFIAINRGGKIRTGVDIVEKVMKNGVKSIAITEHFDSPLAKASDIILCTAVNDRQLPIMLPNITMCQHLTIQLLQVGLLVRHYDRLKDKIDEMYNFVSWREHESK